MATVERLLSKGTKLRAVIPHAQVIHVSKDASDCYKKKRSPSQPIQSLKTRKGDEHEMDLSFFTSLSEYEE